MIGLNFPCCDTSTIIKLASKAIDQIFQPGYSYHKAGIMMLDLIPSDIHQKDLESLIKKEVLVTMIKMVKV